jgi:hypothetical protein
MMLYGHKSIASNNWSVVAAQPCRAIGVGCSANNLTSHGTLYTVVQSGLLQAQVRTPPSGFRFCISEHSEPTCGSCCLPAERCLQPYFSTILVHCVPLPLPGPPSTNMMMVLGSTSPSLRGTCRGLPAASCRKLRSRCYCFEVAQGLVC